MEPRTGAGHPGPIVRILEPGLRQLPPLVWPWGFPGIALEALQGSLGPSTADASHAGHALCSGTESPGSWGRESYRCSSEVPPTPPLTLRAGHKLQRGLGAGTCGTRACYLGRIGTPASLLAGPGFTGSEVCTIQGNLFKKKNSKL